MTTQQNSGYREVEHTADWALQVWAPTLEELFILAAQGMNHLAEVSLDGEVREEIRFEVDGHDHETLLVRNRSSQDGALPSGAGVAIETIARLAVHLERPDWTRAARRHLDSYADPIRRFPTAFPSLLIAAGLL